MMMRPNTAPGRDQMPSPTRMAGAPGTAGPSSAGQGYPDVSQMPEVQREDGAGAPPPGSPITAALQTLATFAKVQEDKGNPAIKQALSDFLGKIAQGLGAGATPGAGIAPQAPNAQGDATPAPNAQSAVMPKPNAQSAEGGMAFNPFENPEMAAPEGGPAQRRMKNQVSTARPMI